MFVRDILADKGTDVTTVGPDMIIRDFAAVLVDKRIGAVVVIGGDGRVAGVISERDVIHGIAGHGAGCLDLKVGALMSTDVISCGPDTTINEVMNRMTERRIRHLPVMDGDALVGVVSIGDVVKRRIAEAERENSQLREYITA
jgi:CBS domain-containing protein